MVEGNRRRKFVLTDEQRIMVEDNIKLAYSRANLSYRKYKRLHKMNFSIDDFVSLAQLALCFCVTNFKPELGYKFSTYAAKYIDLYIKNYIFREGFLIKPPRDGLGEDEKIKIFSLNEIINENSEMKKIKFEDVMQGQEFGFEDAEIQAILDGCLNNREKEIIHLLMLGFTKKEISAMYGVTHPTVGNWVKRAGVKIMRRLNVG